MSRSLGRLLLVVRPLLVVAVVAGLGLYYLGLAGLIGGLPTSADPTAPATVSASRISVAADGSDVEVVLHVTAGPRDLGPLSVFWIVALPGTAVPWDEPRYVAPAQTISALAAGASTDVVWSGVQMPLPAGQYDVSAWVHKIVGPDRTEHLAGGPAGSFSISRPASAALQLGAGWFQSPPSGPLELQTVRVSQPSPQTQTVTVEASVLNRGPRPVDGSIFWLVGRYTDPEPYRAPFWKSDSLALPNLDPGASRTVTWTGHIGLPAGTYGLSVWLHTELPSGSQHSDGSRNIPLVLQADASHVLRHGPAADLQVASASRDRSGALHLVLQNDGPETSVWLGADVVHEDRRYDWFQSTDEPRASFPAFSLASHAQRNVDVPLALTCAPDDGLTRIRLFNAPSLAAEAQVDDVLVDTCP